MTEQNTPETEAPRKGVGDPVDAPADVPEAEAKGYAVYDRTIGQFVGDRTDKRPTDNQAKAAAAEGHVVAVVRV